jgi:hypothetical protein
MNYWEKREQYEVVLTADNGNMVIRQVEEAGLITMLVEYKVIHSLAPDDFIPFCEKWDYFTKKFNPYCTGFDRIEAGDYRAYKITSRAPWPIAGRIMFATMYPMLNYAKDQHIMIVTDRGLEGEFNKYLTAEDKKNYVTARFHFGGWWFTPNKDSNGKIVSTACFAAVCSDPGGKIPKWLIKFGSP